MKFAIFFCLVALACVAQAQYDVLPHDSWVESAKEKLEQAKQKVDEAIDKVTKLIQEKIAEVKEKAEELTQSLKKRATEITENLYETLKKILEKLERQVEEMVQSAEQNYNVDVSECKLMTVHIREAILAVISNSSYCITEKIEKANSYVQDIGNRAEVALADVAEIRKEANECVKEVNDLKAIVAATACLTKSGARATWAITKQVPGVTVDFVKLNRLISTLKSSLRSCMSKNAVLTIAQEARVVLGSVRQCIAEKIDEANKTKEPQTPTTEECSGE